MKFEVNIGKKYFYVLAGILFLGSLIIYVNAYNENNPTFVGHSWNDVGDIPSDLADGVISWGEVSNKPLGLAGNYEVSCAYHTLAVFCCRMDISNGDTSCVYSSGYNNVWNSYPSQPFSATTEGLYGLSCTLSTEASFNPTCCRINRISGGVSCEQGEGFSGIWRTFAYDPF